MTTEAPAAWNGNRGRRRSHRDKDNVTLIVACGTQQAHSVVTGVG